jgi:hypothetical protein
VLDEVYALCSIDLLFRYEDDKYMNHHALSLDLRGASIERFTQKWTSPHIASEELSDVDRRV